MTNRAWHIGHIVAADLPVTNERISVEVEGEVNHPGRLEVLKGTTILGAIKQAGGFTSMSVPTIHLRRGGNPMPYVFSLRRVPIRWKPNHYRVWFASVRWNGSRAEVDKQARSDVALELGDIISVPMVQ